jgi:hypothetical protein
MMRIVLMLCTTNATEARRFRRESKIVGAVNPSRRSRFGDGTFARRAGYGGQSPVR